MESGLPQIIVGSDTYPPYIYLNNDGIPAGIDVEIATEAFRRMGYAARFETIDWEQKTTLVRVVIQNFSKTIVVQFVFEVIG